MIDGIKRRLANSLERDPWDTEQVLEPETQEVSEPPTDNAVIIAAAQASPGFSPGDESVADYYKSIVRSALDNGGKYGLHQISTPWLRMILAGLEGRPIEPDEMWYTAGEDIASTAPPEIPSYGNLFPSERRTG